MNGGIGLDGLVKTSPPIEKAVKQYVSEVKQGKFPEQQHTYQMKPAILKQTK